ncbi:hypothetical protein CBQ26_03300 [Deinococcus indicus]|uniref:Uncharacterized protein n=1 Tax=Deinococcus indicus TaxID=223556 RepID=A0A246BNV4_9DEIO|nr:hypothetical protein CBQ26_03300 [Deinococcus indicus]
MSAGGQSGPGRLLRGPGGWVGCAGVGYPDGRTFPIRGRDAARPWAGGTGETSDGTHCTFY